MEEPQFLFLQELLDAPGPSGSEQRPAAVFRKWAGEFADDVSHDVLGNSWARLKQDNAPTVVIEGHIDEIGLMITHIDEKGFLWFNQIGGWDIVVFIGQRVRILGRDGDVIGVIGRKAAHLMDSDDEKKVPKFNDLWIDIGAIDRDDAMKQVQVGDAAVLDHPLHLLRNDLIVSRSLDNRVGAFVALEATRLLATNRPYVDVVALAATQEEVSFAGAYTSTYAIGPAVAIVIDVTHATDYPEADKKQNGEITLGGGPVLTRGPSLNPVVYDLLVKAAAAEAIPIQYQAAPGSSGTDADAMIRTGPGVATGLVSIPNRYMHSPNEMVHLGDLTAAARLIAAMVSQIDETTDFRP